MKRTRRTFTGEEEVALLRCHLVDLVSRRAIEESPSWIRRRAILESAEPLYVAGK